MKTKNILSLAALAVLSLTGCSDDMMHNAGGRAVQINVTVDGDTRVNTEDPDKTESSLFRSGDKICLTSNAVKKAYSYNGSTWVPEEGSLGYIWGDESSITLEAKYPSEYNYDTRYEQVLTDQSTVENLRASDIMYCAPATYTKGSNGMVDINMKRETARISLNIKLTGYKKPQVKDVVFHAYAGSDITRPVEIKPYSEETAECFRFTIVSAPGEAAPDIHLVDFKVKEQVLRINGVPQLEKGKTYNLFTELVNPNPSEIELTAPGTLTKENVLKAIEASGEPKLTIRGKVNKADMAVVKAMPEVQVLDISGAQFIEAWGTVTARLDNNMFEKAVQSEIILPDYIENMGEYCFSESGITKVKIPAKATIIPYNCFYACKELTSVEFAQDCKVTKIETYAFTAAKILKSINIPSSVMTLYHNCFQGSYFTELVIPETVKNIEYSVFDFTECNGLENLTIKTKKEGSTISDDIFYNLYGNGNDGDINLVLDDSWFEQDYNPNRQAKINADGSGTWMGAKFKTLKTVSGKEPPAIEIPTISDGCLNVKFPGTIKSDYVKQALGSKTTLKITGKVNKADMTVVKAIPEVQVLDISGAQFIDAKGTVATTLEDNMFEKAVQSEIILPDYIENMGKYCFSFSNITKVKIPAKATIIPYGCFNHSSKLTSVEFAQDCKVTDIETYAFAYTDILSTINIPSSVTTLKDYCFQSSCFTELVIPETVKTIGSTVFAYTECNGLKNLTIKTKKEGSTISDNIFYNLYGNGNDGDINLILDDSWFAEDAAKPNRQAKKNADGIGGTWMGANFKSLKKLSEVTTRR